MREIEQQAAGLGAAAPKKQDADSVVKFRKGETLGDKSLVAA